MIGIAFALMLSSAGLADVQLFGLLKPPPPQMPVAAAIARVPATPAMTATACDLNPTQTRNGQKFDAVPPAKRADVKRRKSSEAPGVVELEVKVRAKYYSNLRYEASAAPDRAPVISLVMKDAGSPILENYVVLGGDAFRLPSTFQRRPAPCNVPKGGIMAFCTDPTVVRVALSREILERMAASGSQRIKWIVRAGVGADYRCNNLSADEASAVLWALAEA